MGLKDMRGSSSGRCTSSRHRIAGLPWSWCFWIAIDCTGQPGVWSDAIESVRPGGLVNLFGGCAPGTSIPLDTHLVHYSELTLKGVYHHRPETFRRALALLADPGFRADLLISGVRPIAGVVDALESMIRKEALKVVIRN